MAGDCPSHESVIANSVNGPGIGGRAENTNGTNAGSLNMDAVASVRASQRAHEQLMAEAQALIEPSGGGVPLSRQETQQLRVTSRMLERMIEQAGEARSKIGDALDRAWILASGATIGEQSKWLGVMTGAYKFLANKDADMIRQLLTYAGSKGAHTGDNPIVRAYEMMESKTKGRFSEHMAFRKKFSDYAAANRILERTGFSFEDLMTCAGTYAVCRHMLERNDFLLNVRWPDLLRKAMSSADQNGVKDVQKYMGYIQELRKHIDDVNPPERLVSGGYTNGQARAKMDDFIRTFKVSREEAEALADLFVDWNHSIITKRIEGGFVPKEVVESFYDFKHMVPVKSMYENVSGPMNDAAIYNPGRYYAIEGSETPPESAYVTMQHYARRAAIEYGAKDFATYAHVLAHMQKQNGRADMGIRSAKYDDLIRMKYYGRPEERHIAETILDDSYGSGIVADLPIINKDGTYGGNTERRYIYFDRDYVSDLTGITGYDLQQAMTRSAKAAATLEPVAMITGLYGQQFTRFTPFFGPVNLIRDAGERLLHMASRSWVDDATGKVVNGHEVLPAYLGNLPRAMRIVTKAVLGKLDDTSEVGQLWNDYVRQGLRMQFTPGKDKQLSFEEIIAGGGSGKGAIRQALEQRDMRGVSNAIGKLGQYKDAVISAFDKWNDIYNNAASLSQFMTLREMGLSSTSAGHATLDLLNLRQHGYITPFLRMMFPFANVTSQSAASMMRSLGLAPDAKGQFHVNGKGVVTMLTGLASASVLYELAREAMGTDDDGNYVMDSMSISDLSRFLPISLGGDNLDFVKLQLPLGPMNILNTVAVGLGRVQRGTMAAEDLVFESIAALARNVSPADWPAFSMSQDPAAYFTQAFTPALARPVVDLAINKDFMGQPITYATGNSYEPKAAQGSSKTERMYHDFAMDANKIAGLDLSPEQWKHLHSSTDIGFLRLMRFFTDTPDSALKVKDPDNPSAREVLGPFLAALGGSMLYGRAHYMQQALFYRTVNDLRERIRDEGIAITSKEYGSDPEQREAYQTKVLRKAGWTRDEIDAFLVADRTQKALRKIDEQVREQAAPLLLGADSTDGIRRLYEEAGRQKAAIYAEANRQLQ